MISGASNGLASSGNHLALKKLISMGDNRADAVGIAVDGKVKAPIVSDAGLPTTLSFIKLLGAKRGVVKVCGPGN